MTMSQEIHVFTDGASSGNPGSGGYGIIILGPGEKVHEFGGVVPDTTNNQMELLALSKALEKLEGEGNIKLSFYIDSEYVLQGVQKWGEGWKARGWKTLDGSPVKNRELWEKVLDQVGKISSTEVVWVSVRGHRGHPGNNRADEIAVSFSKGKDPQCFDGPLNRYPYAGIVEWLKNPADASPYREAIYLSFADGKFQRHSKWSECEASVKNKKGARFQKAHSKAEEREIMKKWGVKI